MAELAGHIAVKKKLGNFTLEIDGQEFPWYTHERVTIDVELGVPSVTLTIVADRVTVDDDITPEETT